MPLIIEEGIAFNSGSRIKVFERTSKVSVVLYHISITSIEYAVIVVWNRIIHDVRIVTTLRYRASAIKGKLLFLAIQ